MSSPNTKPISELKNASQDTLLCLCAFAKETREVFEFHPGYPPPSQEELLEALVKHYGSLTKIQSHFGKLLSQLYKVDKEIEDEEEKRLESFKKKIEEDLRFLDTTKPKNIKVGYPDEPRGDVVRVDFEKKEVYLTNYEKPFCLRQDTSFKMDHTHSFFVHEGGYVANCISWCDRKNSFRNPRHYHPHDTRTE